MMSPKQGGAYVYKLSETSFVARQGEDNFLLHFGKLGLTLSLEELRLVAGMTRMAKRTMESGGSPGDAVIAWARFGDVQQTADGFFVVRLFNCHLCMCKKMLLMLIELCVGAWERIDNQRPGESARSVDADIIGMLEKIASGKEGYGSE